MDRYEAIYKTIVELIRAIEATGSAGIKETLSEELAQLVAALVREG